MAIITSKPCPRCGGSGHYSFNLKDGTRCYGCGGSGQVPCAPKGQKKIPTTAVDLDKAKVGDVISYQCVLYQVVRFKWIRLLTKGWDVYNQSVTLTRLIDGKTLYAKRSVFAPDMEGFLDGSRYVEIDGARKPANSLIYPTDSMIGQIVQEEIPDYEIIEEINRVAVVKYNGVFVLRMRNEDGFLVYVPGYTKAYARQSAVIKLLKELTDEQENCA